ncbi:DUF2927 domain-containing protein [Szabonella alba]|uniref:DUF2927 domain-containing protein n=1 Tax=Szabonella alba TaxID=2804194 RepID=A0A8K0VAJ1_9RHOB|nr:DUF2927 domain-containing protein [Szabonella alba]MBL4917421.1 DUF2927 domain-containing protein [Szabonella alba]
MRLASVLSVCLLTACLPTPGAEVSMNFAQGDLGVSFPPPSAMNGHGLKPGERPRRGNAELARDFLDLSFRMESGRPLPRFSRFEGPVTVRMTGAVPPSAATDLSRLLQRLRSEAGIDIREIPQGEAAITLQFLPRKVIQTTYANVACFVAPRVSGWEEFKAARNTGQLDWPSLHRREKLAVFLPADSSAQEVRDCLHEELAQALGPLNDLYRLTDSVFNDDNFHTSLTGFDMLILRATYAPELRSGMTEAEVAARLPLVLARINPAGGRAAGAAPHSPTPRAWINAIEGALSGSGPAGRRADLAQQALGMARAQGWTDGRLAFSYFAVGRQLLGSDPAKAMSAFAEAGRVYRGLPGGAIHAAHVDMQIAAVALASGDSGGALAIADRITPVVAASENAALMATVLMLRAEALTLQGRDSEAQALRMDSQGWARYGFGSDAQVRARMAEIAALARRGKRS